MPIENCMRFLPSPEMRRATIGPTAVPIPRAAKSTPMPVAALLPTGKIFSPKTASSVRMPPPKPQAGFTSNSASTRGRRFT